MPPFSKASSIFLIKYFSVRAAASSKCARDLPTLLFGRERVTPVHAQCSAHVMTKAREDKKPCREQYATRYQTLIIRASHTTYAMPCIRRDFGAFMRAAFQKRRVNIDADSFVAAYCQQNTISLLFCVSRHSVAYFKMGHCQSFCSKAETYLDTRTLRCSCR